MNKVYTGASMSLDGFVSGPGESGFEHLFAWYGNGDVPIATSHPSMTLSMTDVRANHYHNLIDMTGAIIVGRHLFDMTNEWDGTHPMGVPVVVLTHTVPDGWPKADVDYHFVTTGIHDAVAKASELAGAKVVGANAGTIARQCLNSGLLDEIWIDLVGDGQPARSSARAEDVAAVIDHGRHATDTGLGGHGVCCAHARMAARSAKPPGSAGGFVGRLSLEPRASKRGNGTS